MFGNDQNFNNNQNNNFNNQNADVMPLGQNSNQFNNVSGNYNQEYSMQTGVDTPPTLTEIKPLSDASMTEAPTMSALDPMNVMPEVLPQNKDRLDAYENGSINVQNNGNISNEVLQQNNFNGFNNVSGVSSVNQSYQNFPSNDFNNQFASNSEVFNNVNREFNIPDSQSSVNEFGSINSQISPDGFNIPNIDQNVSNLGVNNQIPGIPDINIENNPNNINNLQQESVNEMQNILNASPVDNVTNNISSFQNTNEIQEQNDYNIIQNDNLGSEKEIEEDINNQTTNDDMLEVIEEADTLDKSEQNEEKITSSGAALEEIKSTIEKLKENGIRISLQEFDFDKLYQLIIKIDK